ncbi:MAG TPA: hypothetical protein VG675_20950 [Bryobacteraceae bacterium]|nr:hypothetical protein [Bryobacteraceae bacterium]
MLFRFRQRLRHPFYPDLQPTRAADASGTCVALAGSFPELSRAAAGGVRVQRAVFALTHPEAAFLSEAERDYLWQVFQVPIFALLLDANGKVLGYECEVQEGFHLTAEAGRILPGPRDNAPCECGRPGCRLKPAE